jgi:hypothetical protein
VTIFSRANFFVSDPRHTSPFVRLIADWLNADG